MMLFNFNMGVTARLDASFDYSSCLQTEIDAHYADLVALLGEPNLKYEGDEGDHKVDVEWRFRTSNDELITIYNYKDGKNYLGSKGKKVQDIKEWHIGGSSNPTSLAFAEELQLQCARRKAARK